MFDELIKKLEKIGKIQEGYEELLKLKEKSEITSELLSVLFLLEIKLNLKKQAISTVSKLI